MQLPPNILSPEASPHPRCCARHTPARPNGVSFAMRSTKRFPAFLPSLSWGKRASQAGFPAFPSAKAACPASPTDPLRPQHFSKHDAASLTR